MSSKHTNSSKETFWKSFHLRNKRASFEKEILGTRTTIIFVADAGVVLRWEKCHLQLLTGVLWNALSLLPSGKNNMGFLKAPMYPMFCTLLHVHVLTYSLLEIFCACKTLNFSIEMTNQCTSICWERGVKMNLN